MASASKIEWTDATWNPFAGCAVLSPGCTNCYAMKMAARLDAMGQPLYKGLTKPSKAGPVWRGTVRRASDDVLLAPLRRKKPTKYFVNSMSDLFYETFPDDWIDQVFAVMALCPQHTFQVLTKRPERMREYLSEMSRQEWWKFRIYDSSGANAGKIVGWGSGLRPSIYPDWPLSNVWIGVSCERQEEADERIPLLLQTPAAVRFISAEPLLGPINLYDWLTRDWHPTMPPETTTRIDWVICGGESGPHARPMHPDWARSLRDQCAAAEAPFFFKQRGEYTWIDIGCYDDHIPDLPRNWRDRTDDKFICMRTDSSRSSGYGGDSSEFLYRVGKKAAGRLLDGREHNDFPNNQPPNTSRDSKASKAGLVQS